MSTLAVTNFDFLTPSDFTNDIYSKSKQNPIEMSAYEQNLFWMYPMSNLFIIFNEKKMKNECTILLTAMKNWDFVDGFFVSHSVDSQQI